MQLGFALGSRNRSARCLAIETPRGENRIRNLSFVRLRHGAEGTVLGRTRRGVFVPPSSANQLSGSKDFTLIRPCRQSLVSARDQAATALPSALRLANPLRLLSQNRGVSSPSAAVSRTWLQTADNVTGILMLATTASTVESGIGIGEHHAGVGNRAHSELAWVQSDWQRAPMCQPNSPSPKAVIPSTVGGLFGIPYWGLGHASACPTLTSCDQSGGDCGSSCFWGCWFGLWRGSSPQCCPGLNFILALARELAFMTICSVTHPVSSSSGPHASIRPDNRSYYQSFNTGTVAADVGLTMGSPLRPL